MSNKIYEVHYCYFSVCDRVQGDPYYGNYIDDRDTTDSIWSDEQLAWIRVTHLADELIEWYWYEQQMEPGKDYKIDWYEENMAVVFTFLDEDEEYCIRVTETKINPEEKTLRSYFY